jgi:Na+/H+-dicarboxylate symporter
VTGGPRPRFRVPLVLQLLAAIGLGAVAGVVLGERARPLDEGARLVIKLLKALAGPLVFFAILDAFAHTKIEGRRGLKLVLLAAMNGAVAGFTALLLSNVLQVGRRVDPAPFLAVTSGPPAAPPATKGLDALVPANLLEPFATNDAFTIAILAVLLGVALRALPEDENRATFGRFATASFQVVARVLGWVVHLVPIAAFCVVAKVVGTSGFKALGGLAAFVGVVTLGLFIHAGLYYTTLIWGIARVPPWRFFPAVLEALLTAFSTGSSLATLPVTLRTLDGMKVSPESSRLAACVGTNLNNDGILLYEAVTALFIAQVIGRDLDLGQQLWLIAASAGAAAGIAGIPDAGFITLTLVLASVGLPVEIAPLLLPVDWLLGRLRATTNVLSDIVLARLLDTWGRPTP